MVLNNTPKRSTRSPGSFTRQQQQYQQQQQQQQQQKQPLFSLDSVIRRDPKIIGPSNRLTEAWVREQQDAFPATIVKLAEPSESKIRQHHVQRINGHLRDLTNNIDAFNAAHQNQHRHFCSSGSSKRTMEVKRPKLTTSVPVEVVQQQQLTPESPAGWSGMKEFLMTELRREMALPLHRHHDENQDEKSVNLACPLFIRNPAAFTHVRNSCTDGNIKGGIGKLIEHIKRVHLRSDKQCHHCGARISSKETKSSHSRSCSKRWSPHEPPLLTEEQQRVLENLSVRASGQSLDYKYRHKLLMKLFPGQEEWTKRVEIYHDSYMPCLLPAQLMFEAMEKAVDRWERGYATSTHMYDSDGSEADSDRSRDYHGVSGSSAGASPSTDASSAYPSASSGTYTGAFGTGNGYGANNNYQLSTYEDASWDAGADMALSSDPTPIFETPNASRSNKSRNKAADVDYMAMQTQDFGTYSVDDMDELGSASYVDFEPVFDVVSTVPSDYHSYTMDVEQVLPSDYMHGQYQKDTINPKDMHNTLIGLGSATMPRYLLESEEDSGIVLQDTQEYLGGRRSHR
ncbi:hypothetical protein C8034_v008612 [Colletotrichum sidae]|uniref:Uncharacterized protein n=1 Tax=Colletotrichum sidae TaxID=1347389 RepID=A0A4R8T484_9PEZI|nr:hypothetical protein C8034_v008612 [Colletotrichum sidae]